MPHACVSGRAALLAAVLTCSWLGPSAGHVPAVDTTGPSAGQARARLASGRITDAATSKARIPVRIDWPISSDPSGIDHYVVRLRQDGRWRTVATTSARHVLLRLFPKSLYHDGSYGLRIRAVDRRGNVGPAGPLTRVTVAQYQDKHAALDFSAGWTGPLTRSGAYEGTLRETDLAGRSASISLLNATSVGLVASVAPGRGRLSLSVNGAASGIVALDAVSLRRRSIVWRRSGLNAARPGGNRVVVASLDAERRIDIDAIVTVAASY